MMGQEDNRIFLKKPRYSLFVGLLCQFEMQGIALRPYSCGGPFLDEEGYWTLCPGDLDVDVLVGDLLLLKHFVPLCPVP